MRMTKASVEFAFQGQMEGKGFVEYLMFYTYVNETDPHKSTATYVGLIIFEGKLNGRNGSLTMEDRGTFGNGVAESALAIIPGSGTDQLMGITGSGRYTATPQRCECTLEYELKQ
jgi:hypothetical protein